MAKTYTITADSVPDLDDWGYDDYWACSDWVAWHKARKEAYGKEDADAKVMQYWNQQSTGASGYDCRSFDSAFRDYFSKENLLDALYGNVGFLQIIGAATDVINAASDTVSGISKGVGNTAKALKWLLPLLFAVIVILIIWYVYRKSQTPNK